jgi:hypothetical protein
MESSRAPYLEASADIITKKALHIKRIKFPSIGLLKDVSS